MNGFDFFSYVFTYPNEATLELVSAAAASTRAPWASVCAEALLRTDLRQLQCEYTRLFVSGFPTALCPPYESFYREGILYGAAATEVRECYRAAGYEFTSASQPPDWLAAELEFVALTGDDAFLRRLCEWVPGFAARVAEHSHQYGPCARELEKFLAAYASTP